MLKKDSTWFWRKDAYTLPICISKSCIWPVDWNLSCSDLYFTLISFFSKGTDWRFSISLWSGFVGANLLVFSTTLVRCVWFRFRSRLVGTSGNLSCGKWWCGWFRFLANQSSLVVWPPIFLQMFLHHPRWFADCLSSSSISSTQASK